MRETEKEKETNICYYVILIYAMLIYVMLICYIK